MPMKTSRRRKEKCAHGLCRKGSHPDHHFWIDLRDGLPHIQISACSKDHLEEIRRGAHRFEVAHGG